MEPLLPARTKPADADSRKTSLANPLEDLAGMHVHARTHTLTHACTHTHKHSTYNNNNNGHFAHLTCGGSKSSQILFTHIFGQQRFLIIVSVCASHLTRALTMHRVSGTSCGLP